MTNKFNMFSEPSKEASKLVDTTQYATVWVKFVYLVTDYNSKLDLSHQVSTSKRRVTASLYK